MKTLNAKFQPLLTLIFRLILGAVLVVAGGIKALSPADSASAVASYKILPTQIAHIFGYALPWLEIAIGLLLIIGLSVRFAAITGGVVMVMFIGAIISVWARGILIDCGCFGGGGAIDPAKAATAHRAYFVEILRDAGLVLSATYLYFFPYGRLGIEKLSTHIKEQ